MALGLWLADYKWPLAGRAMAQLLTKPGCAMGRCGVGIPAARNLGRVRPARQKTGDDRLKPTITGK